MSDLEKVKLAIGLKKDDAQYDDLLNLYLEDASDFLKLRLSLSVLPDSLNAIIRGAAVKKFNRLRNEGMSSYSQDGESISFETSDFDEWKSELDQFKADQNKDNQGNFINPYL